MYAITTTLGFIIETRPRGEAGKLLSIFTRDLGLVLASAQGIRLEKSKLRFHSQEYTFGEFSFVRGKEYWRLTNADCGKEKIGNKKEEIENDLRLTNKNQGYSNRTKEIINRVVLLLRRLLNGEQAHPELFDHLEKSFNYLESTYSLSEEQLKTVESLIVFKMLHLLGYIGNDKKLSLKIFSDELTIQQINELSPQRTIINSHINKALKESHL